MRLLGRGVRCVRGGREVFSGLDFEASTGQALAVTGRNGSGKTSLLRLIAGLLTVGLLRPGVLWALVYGCEPGFFVLALILAVRWLLRRAGRLAVRRRHVGCPAAADI